jgi:hypothetical protein
LLAFLGLPGETKLRKDQLVLQLLLLIDAEPSAKTRLFDAFPLELVVGPAELESLLQCSKEERKCWVDEGKIAVLEYRTFRKGRKELAYPVHDRRVILALSQEIVQGWREERRLQQQERKKAGAEIAVEHRRANQHARQAFLTSWHETIEAWRVQASPQIAAILQLAYWTVYASRWAKENHVKYLRSTKHTALYAARRDKWYARKNEAIRALAHAPWAHLSFYRPEDADKRYLRLCEEHYELKHELSYRSAWDFFEDNACLVKQCPRCVFSVEPDFYALYHLEVAVEQLPDLHFSFHMPYSLGKAFFPPPRELPQVHHLEQDGIFRFGRTLFPYERVTHREPDVLKHLEEALNGVKQYHIV